MSILSDFEDRLARAVEGAFAGAFRSPVQPAELARALSHAMDDGKSAGVGKVYAPSVYTIELSRDDAGKLGDAFETVLAAELSTFLIDHARKRDYTLAGSPAVSFRIGRDLKLGRFRVGSEMATSRTLAPAPQAPKAGPAGASSPSGGVASAAKPFVPAPGTVLPDARPPVAAAPTPSPAPAAAHPSPSPQRPAAAAGRARSSGPAFFDHEAPEAGAPAVAVPAAAPLAAATLMVGEEGHVVVLRESRYEIGRTADCAIQAEDANVSRRHAVLVARDGEWTIEDLESTNGTWLRGERVKHAVLRDGDIVTVGATRLFFRSGRG